MSELMNRN